MKTILVLANCKDGKEAKAIAKRLLKRKLIACANIYPVKSIYFWKGELKEEGEITLLMKSVDSLYKDIEREIKLLHSYENPEILSWEISNGSKEYTDWVREETQTKRD